MGCEHVAQLDKAADWYTGGPDLEWLTAVPRWTVAALCDNLMSCSTMRRTHSSKERSNLGGTKKEAEPVGMRDTTVGNIWGS